MKKNTLSLLVLLALQLAATATVYAQQGCPWAASPTNASGVFLGQALVDGAPATAQDCVAALDAGGAVAGVSAIVVNSGIAYINLAIYGDDATTPDADEGLVPGEAFRLHLYQAATGQVRAADADFTCWHDANGAPMSDCGGVATAYVFAAVNTPPSPPVIRTPVDGATLLVGGSNAVEAADAATPFTVAWAPAVDPDGDALTYLWELATTAGFEEAAILLRAPTDTATVYETTVGAVAALLDGAGVGAGGSLSLWHRVLASDGVLVTAGTPAEVTLIRGTLVATEAAEGPARMRLHQNYPNPFNPTTIIPFELGRPSRVVLSLYSVSGQQVLRLDQGMLRRGHHRQQLDLSALASGPYLYVLEIDDGGGQALRTTRVLTLIR